MPQTTTTTPTDSDSSLTSTDLRAETLDHFHPVTVTQTFTTKNKLFDDDHPLTPADSITDAGSVLLVIEHPNGDTELIYEYTETIINTGQPTLTTLTPGDTIWIADWDDIHHPVLTPGSRDYVVATSKSEAQSITPRYDRSDLTILGAVLLEGVTVTVGLLALFASLTTTSSGANVPLFAVGVLLTLGTLLAMKYAPYHEWASSPFDTTASALTAPIDAVPNEDALNTPTSDVRSTIKEYAHHLSDWTPVTVTATDTATGTLTCHHPLLSDSLTLPFESPRKWDAKYNLVRLAQAKHVGSIEHLEGETLYLRYNHHTVTEAAYTDTTNEFAVLPTAP